MLDQRSADTQQLFDKRQDSALPWLRYADRLDTLPGEVTGELFLAVSSLRITGLDIASVSKHIPALDIVSSEGIHDLEDLLPGIFRSYLDESFDTALGVAVKQIAGANEDLLFLTLSEHVDAGMFKIAAYDAAYRDIIGVTFQTRTQTAYTAYEKLHLDTCP